MIRTSSLPQQGFLVNNLRALREWHPHFYHRYRSLGDLTPVSVMLTEGSIPIPVVDGHPYHDVQRPGTEPLAAIATPPAHLGSPLRRTVVVGFGFGYHIAALVANGKAPAVVVTDLDCFATALLHVDLRPLFPVIELFFGDAPPDLPRLTEILGHPVAVQRDGWLVPALQQRLEKHIPEPTGDLEFGTYFGTYRGVTCLKNPLDLMVDQMIISLVRPTVLLEIGTLRGGSALYFNDLLRSMGGERRVHTFDIDDHVSTQALQEEGIYVHGGGHASFEPSILRADDRVLVIEDSSHSYRNTLQVLEKFAPFVSQGSYLIVEDTLADAERQRPHLDGGPIRALDEFLPAHPEFEVDSWWERFYGPGTNNVRGFLRRRLPTGLATL